MLRPTSTGNVVVAVTASTIAVVNWSLETLVLKTSGCPELSSAPVSKATADSHTLGPLEGPGSDARRSIQPHAQHAESMAFKASIVCCTVAAPNGATAVGSELASEPDFALPT